MNAPSVTDVIATGQPGPPIAATPAPAVAAPAVAAPAVAGNASLEPASPAAPTLPPIINWAAALDQCGGDEKFLIELLGDLWQEIREQTKQLQALLLTPAGNFRRISQLSHAIKGAAANLMCTHLRESALNMEVQATAIANEAVASPEKVLELGVTFGLFENDVDRFRTELVQLGIQISD